MIPVDFRCGIGTLNSYARDHLSVDPVSGIVLVFSAPNRASHGPVPRRDQHGPSRQATAMPGFPVGLRSVPAASNDIVTQTSKDWRRCLLSATGRLAVLWWRAGQMLDRFEEPWPVEAPVPGSDILASCAVARCVSLVGLNSTQHLSFPVGSGRGGSRR